MFLFWHWKYPCGTSCLKSYLLLFCPKSATLTVYLPSYTFEPPYCPLWTCPRSFLSSWEGERVGMWEGAGCTQLLHGWYRGWRWNHCHFGAAFIMQQSLLSISMIDRAKAFVVIVRRVMDVVLTSLLWAMRTCPCFYYNEWLCCSPNIFLLASGGSAGWRLRSEKCLIGPASCASPNQQSKASHGGSWRELAVDVAPP